MSNDLILSSGGGPLQLPDYLQGSDLNVSAGLLATAGQGGNRIGLKGNRFRIIVNGKEESIVEENYLDVIVLGAVPHISRIFYEGNYVQDEKASPTCYSADGIAPPDDVKAKQSNKCDTCPQNQKGSKIVNGVKIKACGFFQRLIVMIAGDPDGTEFQIDVKSMGIFGESLPEVNKFNIRDYTKLLKNRGADVAQIVTRLTFDTNSSVPKLLFSPARFVGPDEVAMVTEKVKSDTVANMLKINMTTVDIAGEVDLPAGEGEAARETVTETPMQAARQEIAKEAATPAPAPAKQVALIMTEKANNVPYDEFVTAGWDDEALIAEGYATRPAPPKPATPPPPPKATAPAAPPKPAVPAKPAAPAPSTQRRAPGRPPGSTNRTAAQTAPAAAAPAQAPPRAAAPPPTVTKAHPVPAATADTTVQETTTDSEVDDILASLA
jgi:hypothetical protein